MATGPEPPGEPTLTVVAVLGAFRWLDFRRELKRLRREGHVIELEDSGGLWERRIAVTARIDILNQLLGGDR